MLLPVRYSIRVYATPSYKRVNFENYILTQKICKLGSKFGFFDVQQYYRQENIQQNYAMCIRPYSKLRKRIFFHELLLTGTGRRKLKCFSPGPF